MKGGALGASVCISNGEVIMLTGKTNITAGLFFLAAFMLYGFFLIYMRDFAPGKEQWIAQYATGDHFQSRLSHVHGNLFALLNIVVGLVMLKFRLPAGTEKGISALALTGMLMPIGILSETLFGAPPIFVMVGGVSMVIAMLWLAIAVWKAPSA